MSQVENHSRKKARFGQTQQKTERVKTERRSNEDHRDRDNSPGDEDSGDPNPRADAVHDQIARHFKEEISDEENARAKSKNRFTELQILVHLKRGKANV